MRVFRSLEIEPRAERHVTLLLAAASTRAEAADRLLRSRREGRICSRRAESVL